jgi:hypothetical protein
VLRNWATGCRRDKGGEENRSQRRIDHARLQHTLWMVEMLLRSAVVMVVGGFTVLVIKMMSGVGGSSAEADVSALLFFHRAAQLNSGLSPVLPVLLSVAGFATWSTWHLSRIRLLKKPSPFEVFAVEERATGIADQLKRRALSLRQRLFLVVPNGFGLTLLTVLVLLGMALTLQFNRTLESIALNDVLGRLPNPFDLLLMFSVLSALGGISWGLYRFWTIWDELKRLLDDISASSFLTAFERVPKRVSQLSQLTLRQKSNESAFQRIAATQWGHLIAIRRQDAAAFAALQQPVQAAVDRVVASAATMHRDESPFDIGESESNDELCRQKRRAASNRICSLFDALQLSWTYEPQKEQVAKTVKSLDKTTEDGGGSTSGRLRRVIDDASTVWLRVAEETVAVQVVAYIEWVLCHLRALALFLLVGILLATGILSSYPFQPQSAIKLLFVGLLGATVGSILFVMTQMNRDEVISRITRSDPGRVTWNASYVINLFIFGLLPVLAFVGSDVAPIRDGILSWFEPLARVLTQH